MPAAPPALAFFIPGGMEWIVLVVIGLLLFGRRLPEVARALGKTAAEFRRGFDTFKREMMSDDSIRGARSGLDELKRTVEAPKRLTDPRKVFQGLTDEVRSAGEAPVRSQDPAGATASEEPRPDPGADA